MSRSTLGGSAARAAALIRLPPTDDELLELGEELCMLVNRLADARQWISETDLVFGDDRADVQIELWWTHRRACMTAEAAHEQIVPLCHRIQSMKAETVNGKATRHMAAAILQNGA
jgi:hypothetical protein